MALSQLPEQPVPVVSISDSQAAYLWSMNIKTVHLMTFFSGLTENTAVEGLAGPTLTPVTKLLVNAMVSFPLAESLPQPPGLPGPPGRLDNRPAKAEVSLWPVQMW